MAIFDAPLTMALCVLDSLPAAAMGGRGKKGREGEVPGRLMFLSDVGLWRRAQRAMTGAHVSQMVWFRWGWVWGSRYMVVNDLRREKGGFK